MRHNLHWEWKEWKQIAVISYSLFRLFSHQADYLFPRRLSKQKHLTTSWPTTQGRQLFSLATFLLLNKLFLAILPSCRVIKFHVTTLFWAKHCKLFRSRCWTGVLASEGNYSGIWCNENFDRYDLIYSELQNEDQYCETFESILKASKANLILEISLRGFERFCCASLNFNIEWLEMEKCCET